MQDRRLVKFPRLLAKNTVISLLVGLLVTGATVVGNAAIAAEQVVLLHGLARTENSMDDMQKTLQAQGFEACNVAYPSRHHPIDKLVSDFVLLAINNCFDNDGKRHFVTHSLGGILVRKMAEMDNAVNIGRVVMLSPPNQGTEAVDKLHDWAVFQWINGPAGQQLGTGSDSVPNQLGPVDFELGIITGNRSINWILSTLIPGPDDGKVAVERARVAGMNDFLVVEQTHPLIMNNRQVQCQAVHFLKTGQFAEEKFRGRKCQPKH